MPGAADALAQKGAVVAGSTADAARDVDAVVTMLPSTPHVRDVYLTHVFPAARPGTLLIDSSTIEPGASKELAALAGGHKVCWA